MIQFPEDRRPAMTPQLAVRVALVDERGRPVHQAARRFGRMHQFARSIELREQAIDSLFARP